VSVRAGIVVTGTEVLSGRVQDRNGPWLADRLLELGVDLAHVTICGDRPEDMEAQLRFLADQGARLVLTSGGLGPTADDLTTEVVARFCGRPLVLDPELESRIAVIVERLSARWRRRDPEAVRAGTRKQAMVPEGATVLEPAGTAPGVVVTPADGSGPTVVVLPGPPRELHEMWPRATVTPELQAAIRGRAVYEQHMLRLWGLPESEIAQTLREAAPEVPGFERLEITTCLRRGELEVVVRNEADDEPTWERLRAAIAARHADTLFSDDGSSVDEQVARLLDGRTVAVAESCTGGLLAARLTERAGASAYVDGGVVAYSNEAKVELLGVPPELIADHGAVSPQVAAAMSAGAVERFGADLGVAVTGVAGPDGGSADKPVGYVCWAVTTRDGGAVGEDFRLPGDRADIRDRSTTVALHLMRRVLLDERPAS
jgi:nicotinamide-nucleotide amidase